MSATLPAPLPAISSALSAFTHAPPETTRIRQFLTSHLDHLSSQPRVSSAVGSPAEFAHFLDLELGRPSSSSPSSPEDGSDAVYRNYVAALREHAAAKRAFEAEDKAARQVAEEFSCCERAEDEDGEALDGSEEAGEAEAEGWKAAYLASAQLRRKYARLSLMQAYATELASTEVLQEGALKEAYTEPPPAVPEELTVASSAANGAEASGEGKETSPDKILLQLQKKLIAATAELGEEKRKVQALQEAQQQQDEVGNQGKGARRKLAALVKTRDTLVELIDTELSKIPADELQEQQAAQARAAEEEEEGKEKPQQQQRTLEAVLGGIHVAYEGYLASREVLLALLASPATPTPIDPVQHIHSEEAVQLPLAPLPAPQQVPEVLRVLQASEHLLPLSHAQKLALDGQNRFVSKVGEQRKLLADALDATSHGAHEREEAAGDDVKAAAEARVDAAEKAMREAQRGAKRDVGAAKEWLEKARELVGEVEDLACVEKEKKRSAIPVKGRRKVVEEGPPGGGGVWAQLGGGVGVIGDGI